MDIRLVFITSLILFATLGESIAQEPARIVTEGVLEKSYPSATSSGAVTSSTSQETTTLSDQIPMKVSFPHDELDEHALRIAADCLPVDASGEIGEVIHELNENSYAVPTTPITLPPHPGPQGLSGIHGIDINADCVRDDIEHFLFELYGKKDQEHIRLRLFAHAIWLNFFLLEGISDKTAQAIALQSIKTSLCLDKTLPGAASKESRSALFAQMHNTDARTYRYFDNMKVLSGFLIKESVKPAC